MKILIVNISDIQGGAAKAAYRLHKALVKSGVESQMLVQNKTSDDFTVLGESNKIKKFLNISGAFLDSLVPRIYKKRTKTLFSPALLRFNNIIKTINDLNPDIVHLHWICGGMMKIEDISRIKAPVVWSLHDMWAFTGGCHYDEGCEAYKKSCGNCKILGSEKQNDLSTKVFTRKQKAFANKKNMTIVGLSKWLNACSKNSTLLKEKKHINLPNPIQTDIFKPFDKEKSRELWNLPKDKKLVLFGAMSATSDPRKGFKELRDAMGRLVSKDIEFVVFGSSEPQNAPDFGFKTHYLGHLHDDVSLVTLYSAVDVTVVPSLQENLSNVILESLACATPVVGLNIGGNSDMIEHKKTGYLAKPFEGHDLACGIEWVLHTSNYDVLCTHAREKAVREFDSKAVAEKYIRLYREVLHAK